MTLKVIQELVQEDLQAFDDFIQENLQVDIPFISELCHYIMDNGGKRLRPLILILGAKACQYDGNSHIPLATAIEFFHAATLLHDDVVDSSSLRRGQPTANHKWGSKASVLVGDFLFTRAFQIMLLPENIPALKLLADTSNTITQGEILQLLNCHNTNIDETVYRRVIDRKTAALFSASSQIGALLAQAPQALCEHFAAYGRHVGTAFQIIDDTLDYTGDIDAIGKNIGDDLTAGIPTLPLIVALERGNTEQQKIIRESIQQSSVIHLESLLEIIRQTDALEHSQQIAARESELAIAQLENCTPSAYLDALREIAIFACERRF